MKTYSRRVNNISDGCSSKRKLAQQPEEVELPSKKPKTAHRLIQDYFKPKQATPPRSSSSILSREDSCSHADLVSTPPSPPPAKSPVAARKIVERPRRRIAARANVQKLIHASIISSDVENEGQVSRRNSSEKVSSRQPLKTAATHLQQVQLDMGVSAMKQCKACGMEYNSTNSEDRKLHDEYHKRVLKGAQPNRMPSGLASKSAKIEGRLHEICVLDCRSPIQFRMHFEQALKMMYTDLPGDEISSDDLWSEIRNPVKSSILSQIPRFTIFMLLINRTPAAILVAERISKGGGYLDDFRIAHPGSDVSARDMFKTYGVPDVVKPARMSVDRIWVKNECRRKGLASTLINHARKALIPGLEIPCSQVAFSWPTSLGRALATRYSLGQHDEAIPFLVNLDDCPGI